MRATKPAPCGTSNNPSPFGIRHSQIGIPPPLPPRDSPARPHYHSAPMPTDTQIIYSMTGVSKTHEKKVILKDIYLSYYYGAKIGVLGLNGAGKSSLLRIMAGVDKNYDGQISAAKGYSIGFLEQEPQLDPTKTVKETVLEGLKH